MSQGLCPSCGAAVNLTAGQDEINCTYCGTLVKRPEAEAQFAEVKNSKFGGTLLIAETSREGGSYEEAIAMFEKYKSNLLGVISDVSFKKGDVTDKQAGIKLVKMIREVEGFNPRLLIGATSLSLNSLVDTIHANGGLAVASHIDREYFGVLGQLGFIPPDAAFDALEISALTGIKKARGLYPELSGYTFITSSDAHYISDIGRSPTGFSLEAPSFAEIRLALKREAGRRVVDGS